METLKRSIKANYVQQHNFFNTDNDILIDGERIRTKRQMIYIIRKFYQNNDLDADTFCRKTRIFGGIFRIFGLPLHTK